MCLISAIMQNQKGEESKQDNEEKDDKYKTLQLELQIMQENLE